LFFFSSRRRHTRLQGDWSSDVCFPIFNRTLQQLDLGSNFISVEGVKAVAGALKANRTLLQLNLDDDSLGAEGAKVIAEALKVNQIGRASCRERGLDEAVA